VNSSFKTIVWRTVVAAAIVILIAGCFYAEENARGLRAWRNAEREITARGESLNWDDYIPQPVPDDQNFFTAPMMAEWFVRSTNGTPARTTASLPRTRRILSRRTHDVPLLMGDPSGHSHCQAPGRERFQHTP